MDGNTGDTRAWWLERRLPTAAEHRLLAEAVGMGRLVDPTVAEEAP